MNRQNYPTDLTDAQWELAALCSPSINLAKVRNARERSVYGKS